jgi:hypothetical protein
MSTLRKDTLMSEPPKTASPGSYTYLQSYAQRLLTEMAYQIDQGNISGSIKIAGCTASWMQVQREPQSRSLIALLSMPSDTPGAPGCDDTGGSTPPA